MASEKEQVYTPALKAAEDDLRKFINASCYLVISHEGYWGRGKDVEEAAKTCIKEGASKSGFASVLLIIGDTTAQVNSHGYIIRDAGSYNLTVIGRIRLGALLTETHKS